MREPKDSNKEDLCFWGETNNGHFGTKSMYNLIASNYRGIENDTWEKLWKLQGPQRVRTFLWLSQHKKLLTNEQHVIRHLEDSMDCNLYGNGNETVLHVLRDCLIGQVLWDSLGAGEVFPNFFN